MSILDINSLINEEICPRQSILMQWLVDNLDDRYIDRKCGEQFDTFAMDLPFTVIKTPEGWWSFKPKRINAYSWTMSIFMQRYPLYIKKGTYIPYFIKRASELFYEIKFT